MEDIVYPAPGVPNGDPPPSPPPIPITTIVNDESKSSEFADGTLDQLISGIGDLTIGPDNATLHEAAQNFYRHHSIELEYDPLLTGMASTIRGKNVKKHKVLFVFLGPSDPAIENREIIDGIWDSFRTKNKWLRTIAICNDLLDLATSEMRRPPFLDENNNPVTSLDEVYMMDIFPWKRWAAGANISFSDRDKDLAKKWYRLQKELIEPSVIIFFNTFGKSFLENSDKRLSISRFGAEFLVDTKGINCATLRHPGALRLSPFEFVEEYLNVFIIMNFILSNTSPVPRIYYENAVDHFKCDNLILNTLRASLADSDLTMKDVKEFLSNQGLKCPSDTTLRLILGPFQKFEDNSTPCLRGRAFLYRFSPIGHRTGSSPTPDEDFVEDNLMDYEDCEDEI